MYKRVRFYRRDLQVYSPRWSCESPGYLSHLASLTNLRTLDLSSCSSLIDLSPLAGLKNLSYINSYDCSSLSEKSKEMIKELKVKK